MKKGYRAYAAEFVGTFVLVFAGTSAILGNALVGYGDGASVAIPLAFGLALVVAIFALGHVSGGHFNPAVTLAFALRGHTAWGDVPGYLVAQLAGATLASAVLTVCFSGFAGFTTGPTMPGMIDGQPISLAAVGVFEFAATFVLMFVITAVATDDEIKGVPAGLAIGFTVAAMALGTGWVGGGSFNPARSFGPAIVGGVWTAHWLYWIAPILGAAAGITAYETIRGTRRATEQPPVMRDTTLA